MAPSDRDETADALTNNTNNCHNNGGNNSVVRFQDYVDVNDPKGPPGTKQECTKLIYNLNREVAIYCCLSMGLGGVSDSYTLRDELRSAASRLFDLVLLCKRRLMPLLLSKRLKEEERQNLERLYRIFVGCLEMLQAEFIRSMTLQSMFPLWDSSTLLIQTGVSETVFHKKSCNILDQQDSSGAERKLAEHEELTNLERKVTNLQEMCYTTSQMMDINPWDCKPDTDHTKIDIESSEAQQNVPSQVENHMHSGNPRHRKCILIMVFVIVILVVVSLAFGLSLALTKNETSKD